jgi:hypothetical protein
MPAILGWSLGAWYAPHGLRRLILNLMFAMAMTLKQVEKVNNGLFRPNLCTIAD